MKVFIWKDQTVYNKIVNGDSLDVLKTLDNNQVDLIVTSPPYANQRKSDYGGISHSQYVEWFLPISEQLLRVLKPTGSFILNIKENVVDGERSTYVYELVIALRKQGWLWTEEYLWNKTTSTPGYWPNRLRDSWEHLYHFTKNKKFSMYQESVKIPASEATVKRMQHLGPNDLVRRESVTNSGFGVNISNCHNDMVLPSNVLTLSTVTHNKQHSASFPDSLPTFFIKLFTQPGDVVLDPFSGSGTVGVVSKQLKREYILIEKCEKYYNLSKENIGC